MAGPIGAFAAFVLPRLPTAVLVGERLGPRFSNVLFFGRLGRVFPELSRGQIGTLASAAMWAARAGLFQSGIAPPGVLAQGDVPSLHALRAQLLPGNNFLYRFRLGYVPTQGAPFAFTTGVFESSQLVGNDILLSAAQATLTKRIIDSPEAFGFQQPGEVEIDTLFVQYIIQGV